MSARLIDFLLAREPRERWLLAVLAIVIVPLGLVFGVLLPLYQSQEEALAARTEAVAMNLWVQDRALDLERLRQIPETGQRPAIGMRGIEEGLISAGLRDAVSDLSQDSSGRVSLRFEQVRFTRLMTWITETEPGWGYDLQTFRIEAAPVSGDVEASMTLVPQTQQ